MTTARTASRTRRRRRRGTPPPGPIALRGLAVVVVLLLLAWGATRVYDGLPAKDYQTVYLSAPDVGNMLTHDPVRIAGSRVGQVLARDLGEDGRPRLKLQLEPGTDLTRGTTALVRANGLLGARSVELRPGRGRERLPDGTTIRAGDGSLTYGLPEALDTLDRDARTGLGRTLGELGAGTLGNGRLLNEGIVQGAEQAKHFEQAMRTVLARDGAARRLIPSLDAATTPLARNARPVAELTGVTADAVAPLIGERRAVRDTLDEAPSSLRAVRGGVDASHELLASLRSASFELDRTLPDAKPGLATLAALLRESRRPLERTTPLLRSVRPAVPAALRITRALDPLLAPTRELSDRLGPMFEMVTRYRCNIVNFGLVFPSVTGFSEPGEGPAGPSGSFRAEVFVPTADALHLDSPIVQRDGYQTPCTYLADREYDWFIPRRRR